MGKPSRKLILIFLTLLQAHLVSSQTLIGKVLSESKPMESANIYLYPRLDSTKMAGFATADTDGKFQFMDIPPGPYLIKVQRIGFLVIRKEMTVKPGKEVQDLGSFDMLSDRRTLQGVTVTAPRKIIQKTPQGFVVRAEDNITSGTGTATDLLANTPTVIVDAEGAISMRGKSPQVLVNGRNSALTTHNLDRIPASSIDRIEIINTPGARYDADAEGGIINIILKKNTKPGTNGAFAIGAGYGAKYRLNSSFILNHQFSPKLNLGVSYDNRFAGRKRYIDAQRENFNLTDEHFLVQHRDDDRSETEHNFKLNLDYDINKKNSLGFEGIYGHNGQHNMESLTSNLQKSDRSFTSANNRFSDEIPNEDVFELSSNYAHKFNDSRRSLTAELSTSFEKGNENTDITTRSLDQHTLSFGEPFLQQTHNLERSGISNGRIDYAFPVTPRTQMEIGYKGIFRHLNANFRSLYEQGGSFIPDPRSSNIFTYGEQVNAAYAQMHSYVGDKESPKMRYEAGIRFENMSLHGESSGADPFRHSYFNVFPTATISWYTGKQDFFKVNIGRRINRPGLGMLNPFLDITDSLNPHSGNPDLKPELVNTLEMGYNKEWRHFSLTSNLFYRRGTNTIMNYVFLDSTGKALSKPINLGTATTYGLESILGAQFNPFWQANMSISLFQQHLLGQTDGQSIKSDAFTWYVKMTQNFSFWKGSKFQFLANYQAPVALPQGKRIAVYNVDFGFQQKIMKGQGRMGIAVTDIFNTQRNGNNLLTPDFSSWRRSRVDSRAVILTFGYTFGTTFKEKLMEYKYSND